MIQENILSIIPPITALTKALGFVFDKLLRCMKKLARCMTRKNKLAASNTSVSKPLDNNQSLKKSMAADARIKMANTGYNLDELVFKIVLLFW